MNQTKRRRTDKTSVRVGECVENGNGDNEIIYRVVIV